MAAKILIVGPAWVGDMVMAQGLYKLLKEQGKSQIDVLAPTWTFALLSRMPEVNQAIEMPLRHGELNWHARYQIAQKLRYQGYDQAIVMPNSLKSALIPWLARIPKRTGWRGEWRYGLLNDVRRLDRQRYPRMIEQFIALGLPSGIPLPDPYPYPELQIDEQSRSETLQKLKLPLSQQPILALCPGAEFGPAKRWPEAHYAQLANQKLHEGWAIWLFGSSNDRPVTEKIMSLTNNRCVDVSGLTDLSGTIDLLSLCQGVVTNDSGLMHIAAALHKPIIALYGSTSPAFTPPLSKTAQVLKLDLPCQPCFKRICPLEHQRCLRELSVARVLTAMNAWGYQ